MDLADFDAYCGEHGIQPDELGPAFAAWLHLTTNWDGPAEPADPPPAHTGGDTASS